MSIEAKILVGMESCVAPPVEDLLKVGQKAGMKEKRSRQIAGEIKQIVQEQLGKYLDGK